MLSAEYSILLLVANNTTKGHNIATHNGYIMNGNIGIVTISIVIIDF